MRIMEEKCEEAAVCFLEGEIDGLAVPQLRQSLSEMAKRSEKKVLVDFSAVTYIDSAGLAALIEAFLNIKMNQGRIRFCGMNPSIRNIFEITKLYKRFEIFDTRQSALEDF